MANNILKSFILTAFLVCTFSLSGQENPQCPKCSYDYMTIIVKEGAPSKLTMYISRTDNSEMMVKDMSNMSLEQFQYTGVLTTLKDLSKEGWRVMSSNMTFETEENKKTRLYFLLYKAKSE